MFLEKIGIMCEIHIHRFSSELLSYSQNQTIIAHISSLRTITLISTFIKNKCYKKKYS